MRAERRALRPLQFPPTEAKFRPSVRPDGLVLRGALVDRLTDGESTGVVVVTAPPGYGKTVLASQWSSEDPRPFMWLTLDAADNDPRVLTAYLALALHRIQPVEPGVLEAIADSHDELVRDALLRQLVRAMGDQGPLVLVLDGVEVLHDPRALEVLRGIGRDMTDRCQLVLVGRSAPAVDWSELSARGHVLELGMADLRLDRAEALALVQGAGLELPLADVDALLVGTEGWAAGLYLAALALAEDADQRQVGQLVDGSDSLIAEYFDQELLAGLPAEEQVFLLRTSVLHELSGPVCDAVLETRGSAELLEHLADANVLLARSDAAGTYHVHPLLAEALQAALTRREPRDIPVLHRRASLWYEDHDEAELAIEHAIAGHEIVTAARLVWNQVGRCLSDGEVAKLEQWLSRFPPRQIATHAKLALTAAWCALQRGRPADHWIALAEHGRYEAERKGESSSVAAETALLRAVVGRHGVAQMGADARLALDLQQLEGASLWTAEFLVALSLYLSGRSDEARVAFERVEHAAHAGRAHQPRVLALCELALLAADDGDWTSARTWSDLAMSVLQQHHLGSVSLLAPVHCAAALVAAHEDDPHRATPVVQQAVRLLALAVEPPTWGGVQCREALARAELSLGDTPGARMLLSEAQTLLLAGDDEALRDRVELSWRRVSGRPLEVSPGTTLTRAELRVLQLLPTHLSFAQIGQQLFVSRNTVKTQAVSAYRKLGVASRSEAVDRAASLGLLVPAQPEH